jgi:hypothetical protein
LHLSDVAVTVAGSDVSAKLALVSVLTQYGGANFDTVTGTQTISSLLAGLSYDAVCAHVHGLVGAVASFKSAGAGTSDKRKRSKEDRDGSDGDSDAGSEGSADEAVVADAVSALDALVSLARNAHIAHRGLVSVTVAAVLARLSTFGAGAAHLSGASNGKGDQMGDKKAPKKRKGSAGDLAESADLSTPEGYLAAVVVAQGSHAQDLPLPPATVTAIGILDAALKDTDVPDALAAAAGTRLLSLLADLGNLTLQFLDTPPVATTADSSAAEATTSVDSTPTLLRLAWQALWQLHSSGLPVRVAQDDDEGTWEDLPGLLNTVSVLLRTEAAVPSAAEESQRAQALSGRLTEALHALLAQSVFHTLVSNSVDIQVIQHRDV